MATPMVNVHDGKHRMILAEDGERVLTSEQNKTWEMQHKNDKDFRKEPMHAEVYDDGGSVGSDMKARIAQRASEIYSKLKETPAGGAEAEGLADKNRNVEQYKQGVAAENTPSTQMRSYAAPVDADRIHPGARYGMRPMEKRLDPQGNTIDPRTPQGMGAAGPSRPVPTALYDSGGVVDRVKKIFSGNSDAKATDEKQRNIDEYNAAVEAEKQGSTPTERPADVTTPEGMGAKGPKRPEPKELDYKSVYDEGGDVSADPDKEAAVRQATTEVQAEERGQGAPADFAGPVFPYHKDIKESADTDQPQGEPQRLPKGVEMRTGLYKGGMEMNTENPPMNEMGPPLVREASTNSLPKPTAMKQRSGDADIEKPLDNGAMKAGTTDQPSDQAKNEASATAAGYPVQHATPETSPEMNLVKQDQKDAMMKGDLVKLGMSRINERMLKGDEGKGAQVPLPEPVAPTAEENLKNQRDELRHKMVNGATEQERFQAEKDLAELNRRNPWGSEGNHPGIGGKIAHAVSGIAQGVAKGVVPYVLPSVPGSQAQIAQQEARGEQGVEQAQEKGLKAAQTVSAQAQPEIKEQQLALAQEKLGEQARQQGFKWNDTTKDYDIPLSYEEMSPSQQAVYDQKESIKTLNEAKGQEQNAKAVLERYKADPNNAQNQASLARIQDMAKKTAIAAGKLGLDGEKFVADYFGVDKNGQPIPGVATTPEGKPVGVKVSKAEAAGETATAQRLNKADLSQNVQLNAKNAIDLIKSNPELFGKIAGRYTNTRQMAGTDDEAIVRLGIQVHNMAVASAGIHGQRGQAAVDAYEKDILNKFHNSPEATIAGLNEIGGSVQTFIDDARAGKKVAPTPKTEEQVKSEIPKDATHTYKDKDGKIVGYAQGGQYHALDTKEVK